MSLLRAVMLHRPRKRFGQNFLVDQQVIDEIIAAISPQPDHHVVEIGPGFGALTTQLIQSVKKLDVVEIDRDLVETLKQQFVSEKLTIHAADALRFDFSALGRNIRIVGNLPYNISTPLLFHISQFSDQIADMHFMLQKEVVERMVGMPSSPQYGRLSVMLQYRFHMEHVFTVPATAFRPMPKIESAIVRMLPVPRSDLHVRDEKIFARIVAAAFSQRRKTLRNSLQEFMKESDYAMLGIDPGLRAENLSVTDYVNIANHLAA